jgi:hypothetical protein
MAPDAARIPSTSITGFPTAIVNDQLAFEKSTSLSPLEPVYNKQIGFAVDLSVVRSKDAMVRAARIRASSLVVGSAQRMTSPTCSHLKPAKIHISSNNKVYLYVIRPSGLFHAVDFSTKLIIVIFILFQKRPSW